MSTSLLSQTAGVWKSQRLSHLRNSLKTKLQRPLAKKPAHMTELRTGNEAAIWARLTPASAIALAMASTSAAQVDSCC